MLPAPYSPQTHTHPRAPGCYPHIWMPSTAQPEKNRLYYGDNLQVLRDYIADASVDLIYLDPPFNSRQDYNVLFAEKTAPDPPARSPPSKSRSIAID